MEEKQIQKNIQAITPRIALWYRVDSLTKGLPMRGQGFNFPLLAFRLALVGLLLIIFVGIGSGVVVAEKFNKPGSSLYPFAQAIEKNIQNAVVPLKQILEQPFQGLPSPTPRTTFVPTPTSTTTSTATPKNSVHSVHVESDQKQKQQSDNEHEDKKQNVLQHSVKHSPHSNDSEDN